MQERIRVAPNIKKQKLQEFDFKCNVDFSKTITRDELGYNDHCFGYQPSFAMPNIFDFLHISEKQSLLDVGCGKGFAMHLFSKFPFYRIDGIETNHELAIIAKKNLEKLHPGDSRFSIYELDARDFLNYAEYDVLYLFNPFDEIIISDICKKMGKKYPSRIIYQMPHYIDIFIKCGYEIEYEADATVILRR